MRKIIAEVKSTSETAESDDDNAALDYKEYVSSKFAVESLAKL